MTSHLRLDDSRPRGVSECVCGEPGCTRWYDDARALLGDPASHERDTARRRERERGPRAHMNTPPASSLPGQADGDT